MTKINTLEIMLRQYGPFLQASSADVFTETVSLDDDPENINGEVSYAMPVLRFKSIS